MARKMIARKIAAFPKHSRYVVEGAYKNNDIELMVEELEAMRLKDVEELNQQDAALIMGISRQTFQNIVDGGRKKVAQALFSGHNIQIVGGNHVLHFCQMQCADCDSMYPVEYIDDKKECPSCGSDDISCVSKKSFCNRWCMS